MSLPTSTIVNVTCDCGYHTETRALQARVKRLEKALADVAAYCDGECPPCGGAEIAREALEGLAAWIDSIYDDAGNPLDYAALQIRDEALRRAKGGE